MPLTDVKARSAKPDAKAYKLADSGGLFLLVATSGSKLWRWKYRLGGKENLLAIGEYPATSIAEARKARDEAKLLVKRGIHPTHHKREAKVRQAAERANTLEAVAREWIEKKKPRWTPYYLKQVEGFLGADVYPQIGTLPIRDVTAAQLLDIIQRIERRGAATVAILVRQWLSAIFRYSVATLRAEADPAAALRGAITRPRVKHHKPLSKKDLIRLDESLTRYKGRRETVIAIRLLMLTFVRPGELRAAQWEEFDLESGMWRIPAARMKMREAHLVPLSAQALDLLRELKQLTGSKGWLFRNIRRPATCMTITTMNRALERMGFNGKDTIGFSSHGFRATASTMLNELGYRSDVIERQLAHKERNKVRASYNQAEYLVERKAMLQDWANLIGVMTGEVRAPGKAVRSQVKRDSL